MDVEHLDAETVVLYPRAHGRSVVQRAGVPTPLKCRRRQQTWRWLRAGTAE